MQRKSLKRFLVLVLPPVLSSFICCLFIVIKPISRFAGDQFSFLLFTLFNLFFYPNGSIGSQIELTVLGLIFGVIGLGISNLSIYFTILVNRETIDHTFARTIPCVTLTLVAFVAAYARSKLPRLMVASRTIQFVSAWSLTSNLRAITMSPRTFLDLWWPLLWGSLIPLLVSMICFPVSARQQFSKEVIQALQDAEDTQAASYRVLFSTNEIDTPLANLTRLRTQFFKNARRLPALLDECLFEFSYDYVGVDNIAPFVGIVNSLRVSLANGSNDLIDTSMYNKDNSNKDILGLSDDADDDLACVEDLKNLITIMHQAILNSLSLVRRVLRTALIVKDFSEVGVDDIDLQKQLLTQAVTNCRSEMHNILVKNLANNPSDCSSLFKKHLCMLSYYSVTLFKIAADLVFALTCVSDVLSSRLKNRRKIHYPRNFWSWLKAPSTTINDFGMKPDGNDDFLSVEQKEENRHKHTFEEEMQLQAYAAYAIRRSRLKQSGFSIKYWFLNIWDAPKVLKSRLAVARSFRSLRSSRHIKFALKNAAGVAVLSIPCFLPYKSPGQLWFFENKGVWMVISYFYVLEPSTGATYRVGLWRLTGTILGAVYGFIVNMITKGSSIGITAMVTAASVLIAWLVRMSSVPGVGTVFAVTFPPIIFPVYLDTASFASFTIALTRGYMIAIGIIAAILVNLLWWPFHARVNFTLQVSKAISEITKLYLILSRQTLGVTTLAASRTQFNITEKNVQAALNACDTLLEPLRLELSIIPKPVTLYRKMISSLQRTHDLLVSLRYVRERIQKETVIEIKDQRLNFINALVLVFYASMHAFRSSTPLPQFLPSLYTALNDMLSAIDNKLIEILSSDEMVLRRQLSSYRLHYALSEAEILLGLVTSMEEMLSIAKSLFGQTSIFDELPSDEKGDTENLDSLPLHTLGHTGWSSGPTSPTMQIMTSPAKKLSLKHRENDVVEKYSKEYPGNAYILNYSPPGASGSPPLSKDTSMLSISELANKESKDGNDNKDNKGHDKLPPRTHSKRSNRNIEGIPLARDLFQQASSSTSSSPVDQQNYRSRQSSLTSARTSPIENTNHYRTRTRRKDSDSSNSSNTRIR
ncbi:hypothetical protein E3Q17_01223 [Wallemia mellicola]|uniref:ER transporter 6TM N-terminal domain-containing protein n=1 Tax=Wallemia mellicola TaxID=1708541 RepID=A0A4T0S0K2_9BASI|nr:hypothetical protein E3Q24_01517 [Wallemia mellicola]TIC02737.1 hypothetical protein E3Q17_01223 [Wallemia mellicola]TIC13483.1 hypothetical protein E3Q14_01255 [Wallemia mellicola]TIC36122.1 hypothetical protein E3Q09_01695 [Wallemia mellicola]TIC44665.1 hypothetical protein E3Q08_01891 [Wallemia mellicola]